MLTDARGPHLDSDEEGRHLRDFFRASGYDSQNLTSQFGRIGPPSKYRRDLGLLLHQTREPNLLNTLVRWFVIGQAVDSDAARAVIPDETLRLFEKSGLVAAANGRVVPAVILLPLGDTLAASDGPPRDNPRPDLVVGTTPAARVLSQFTVPRKVHSALDLCCGSGLHALQMARQSDLVTGADFNARSLLFARFNARLNAVENVEFLEGDGFAPVAGRSFDLIVSNPPFFLLPSGDFLFRDNPLVLDGFAEKLVRQAPQFLNDGGFFQMIFEWVEVEGQSWQQRLAGWVAESGCDTWIIKHYSQRPIEYCHARIRTADQTPAGDDTETLAQWSEHYRLHHVTSMHGGLIAMRKRLGGRNWVDIEEAPYDVGEPFGELVEAVFDAHDLVVGSDDQALLALRPRLTPGVRLEQVFHASEEGWKVQSVELKLDRGWERACRVDQTVAAFLAECTGKRTLSELIGTLLPGDDPETAQARAACAGVMRQLLRRGFLLNG